MSYQRLSAQDSTFLEIEDPRTPMHVGGCFLFEAEPLRRDDGGPGVDIDRVRDYIESRLHLIPRYRQRIERVPIENHPVWVDDDRFNLQYHVRHTALPAPGDERLLKRLCGRILSQQLDPGKPLWEMWVVEGVEEDRVALVTKVHHAMVDGLSGVDLLQVLLSLTPEKTIEMAPAFYPEEAPSRLDLLRDAALRRSVQPFELVTRAIMGLREPGALVDSAREVAAGLGANLAVGLTPAAETPLNHPVGPHRRFNWLAFDLDAVKEVKNRLGATVNDVVLATVAGAIGEFLRRRGLEFDHADDFDFRAICPVSVRSEDERGTLGNRVASMVASLPIREADPVERLRQVSATMKDLKESKQAMGADILAGVSEWTAPTLMTLATRLAFQGRTANMVVTNVPGPQLPLYLLGARMLETYPMAPLFSTQAVSVALFSYAGGLYWGINADWELVPDLHELVEGIDRAFRALCDAPGGHS